MGKIRLYVEPRIGWSTGNSTMLRQVALLVTKGKAGYVALAAECHPKTGARWVVRHITSYATECRAFLGRRRGDGILKER